MEMEFEEDRDGVDWESALRLLEESIEQTANATSQVGGKKTKREGLIRKELCFSVETTSKRKSVVQGEDDDSEESGDEDMDAARQEDEDLEDDNADERTQRWESASEWRSYKTYTRVPSKPEGKSSPLPSPRHGQNLLQRVSKRHDSLERSKAQKVKQSNQSTDIHLGQVVDSMSSRIAFSSERLLGLTAERLVSIKPRRKRPRKKSLKKSAPFIRTDAVSVAHFHDEFRVPVSIVPQREAFSLFSPAMEIVKAVEYIQDFDVGPGLCGHPAACSSLCLLPDELWTSDTPEDVARTGRKGGATPAFLQTLTKSGKYGVEVPCHVLAYDQSSRLFSVHVHFERDGTRTTVHKSCVRALLRFEKEPESCFRIRVHTANSLRFVKIMSSKLANFLALHPKPPRGYLNYTHMLGGREPGENEQHDHLTNLDYKSRLYGLRDRIIQATVNFPVKDSVVQVMGRRYSLSSCKTGSISLVLLEEKKTLSVHQEQPVYEDSHTNEPQVTLLYQKKNTGSRMKLSNLLDEMKRLLRVESLSDVTQSQDFDAEKLVRTIFSDILLEKKKTLTEPGQAWEEQRAALSVQVENFVPQDLVWLLQYCQQLLTKELVQVTEEHFHKAACAMNLSLTSKSPQTLVRIRQKLSRKWRKLPEWAKPAMSNYYAIPVESWGLGPVQKARQEFELVWARRFQRLQVIERSISFPRAVHFAKNTHFSCFAGLSNAISNMHEISMDLGRYLADGIIQDADRPVTHVSLFVSPEELSTPLKASAFSKLQQMHIQTASHLLSSKWVHSVTMMLLGGLQGKAAPGGGYYDFYVNDPDLYEGSSAQKLVKRTTLLLREQIFHYLTDSVNKWVAMFEACCCREARLFPANGASLRRVEVYLEPKMLSECSRTSFFTISLHYGQGGASFEPSLDQVKSHVVASLAKVGEQLRRVEEPSQTLTPVLTALKAVRSKESENQCAEEEDACEPLLPINLQSTFTVKSERNPDSQHYQYYRTLRSGNEHVEYITDFLWGSRCRLDALISEAVKDTQIVLETLYRYEADILAGVRTTAKHVSDLDMELYTHWFTKPLVKRKVQLGKIAQDTVTFALLTDVDNVYRQGSMNSLDDFLSESSSSESGSESDAETSSDTESERQNSPDVSMVRKKGLHEDDNNEKEDDDDGDDDEDDEDEDDLADLGEDGGGKDFRDPLLDEKLPENMDSLYNKFRISKRRKADIQMLTRCKEEVKRLFSVRERIEHGLARELVVPPFAIEASSAKSSLLAACDSLANHLMQELYEQAQTLLKGALKEYESLETSLKQSINKTEDLSKLWDIEVNLQDTILPGIQIQFLVPAWKRFKILDSLQFYRPLSGLQLEAQTYQAPGRVVRTCQDCVNGSKEKAHQFLTELNNEKEVLKHSFKQLQQRLDRVRQFKELDNVVEYSTEVERLHQEISDAISKMKTLTAQILIHDRPEVARKKNSTFQKSATSIDAEAALAVITAIGEKFSSFYSLWTLVADSKEALDMWNRGPFLEIDPEFIAMQLEAKGGWLDILEKLVGTLETDQEFTAFSVATEVQAGLLAFKAYLPIINMLRSDAVRIRHWRQIASLMIPQDGSVLCSLAGIDADPDDPVHENDVLRSRALTLGKLHDLRIANYQEDIARICSTAEKEFEIENSLDEMHQVLNGHKIRTALYSNSGVHTIVLNQDGNDMATAESFFPRSVKDDRGGEDKETEELSIPSLDATSIDSILDEQIIRLKNMQASKYAESGQLIHRVKAMAKGLIHFRTWLKALAAFQAKWEPMEVLFSSQFDESSTIKMEEKELKSFHFADVIWKKFTNVLHTKNVSLFDVVGLLEGTASDESKSDPDLRVLPLKLVEDLNECMEEINHKLCGRLDKQRIAFPRLYFLNDQQLLDLVRANHTDFARIHKFIPLLFHGVEHLELIWESLTPSTADYDAVLQRYGALVSQDLEHEQISCERLLVRSLFSGSDLDSFAASAAAGRAARRTIIGGNTRESSASSSQAFSPLLELYPRFGVPVAFRVRNEDSAARGERRVPVELWLGHLEATVQEALKQQVSECLHQIPNSDLSTLLGLQQIPFQCLLLALRIEFTRQVDQAFRNMKKEKKEPFIRSNLAVGDPLSKARLKQSSASPFGTEQVEDGKEGSTSATSFDTVEGVRTRMKQDLAFLLSTLRSLKTKSRDLVQRLSSTICVFQEFEDTLKQGDELVWESHVRYYAVCNESQPDKASLSGLDVRMLGTKIHYGFELELPRARLLITPTTMRCMRTLALSFSMHKLGILSGSPGAGKTAIVEELASLTGRRLVHVPLSMFATGQRLTGESLSVLERILKGLEQTSAWMLMDCRPEDLHILQACSVLLSRLLAGKSYSNSHPGLFLTYTSESSINLSSIPERASQPVSRVISQMAMTVHVISPHLEKVAAVYIAARMQLDLVHGRRIASRLACLLQAADGLFSGSIENLASLSVVREIVSHAWQFYQKKPESLSRDSEEEAGHVLKAVSAACATFLVDKLCTEGDQGKTIALVDRLIRSGLHDAVCLSARPSMSPTLGEPGLGRLRRKRTNQVLVGQSKTSSRSLKTPLHPLSITEESTVSKGEQLVASEVVRNSSSRDVVAQELLQSLLTHACTRLGFQGKGSGLVSMAGTLASAFGLFENLVNVVSNQSFRPNGPVLLVGPPRSGKSTTLNVLLSSLSLIRGAQIEAVRIFTDSLSRADLVGSGQSRDAEKLSNSNSILFHVMAAARDNAFDSRFACKFPTIPQDPKSIENLFLGGVVHSELAKELGFLLRNWKMIILDGDSNGDWLEAGMSTFLEQSYTPACAHALDGDWFAYPQRLRIVFETTCLQSASPKLIASAQLVVIQEDKMMNWKDILYTWLNTKHHSAKRDRDHDRTPLLILPSKLRPFKKKLYRLCEQSLQKIWDLSNHATGFIAHVRRFVALFNALMTPALDTPRVATTTEESMEVHVECVLAFSLVWTFGPSFGQASALSDSDLRTVLQVQEPKCPLPLQGSVFDYVYDMTRAEWVSWVDHQEARGLPISLKTTSLQNVSMLTRTQYQAQWIAEQALRGKTSVLVMGHVHSGKSSIMENALAWAEQSLQNDLAAAVTRCNVSPFLHSRAESIRTEVLRHLERYHGTTYGPSFYSNRNVEAHSKKHKEKHKVKGKHMSKTKGKADQRFANVWAFVWVEDMHLCSLETIGVVHQSLDAGVLHNPSAMADCKLACTSWMGCTRLETRTSNSDKRQQHRLARALATFSVWVALEEIKDVELGPILARIISTKLVARNWNQVSLGQELARVSLSLKEAFPQEVSVSSLLNQYQGILHTLDSDMQSAEGLCKVWGFHLLRGIIEPQFSSRVAHEMLTFVREQLESIETLAEIPDVCVLERLLCPLGMSHFGIVPDHTEIDKEELTHKSDTARSSLLHNQNAATRETWPARRTGFGFRVNRADILRREDGHEEGTEDDTDDSSEEEVLDSHERKLGEGGLVELLIENGCRNRSDENGFRIVALSEGMSKLVGVRNEYILRSVARVSRALTLPIFGSVPGLYGESIMLVDPVGIGLQDIILEEASRLQGFHLHQPGAFRCVTDWHAFLREIIVQAGLEEGQCHVVSLDDHVLQFSSDPDVSTFGGEKILLDVLALLGAGNAAQAVDWNCTGKDGSETSHSFSDKLKELLTREQAKKDKEISKGNGEADQCFGHLGHFEHIQLEHSFHERVRKHLRFVLAVSMDPRELLGPSPEARAVKARIGELLPVYQLQVPTEKHLVDVGLSLVQQVFVPLASTGEEDKGYVASLLSLFPRHPDEEVPEENVSESILELIDILYTMHVIAENSLLKSDKAFRGSQTERVGDSSFLRLVFLCMQTLYHLRNKANLRKAQLTKAVQLVDTSSLVTISLKTEITKVEPELAKTVKELEIVQHEIEDLGREVSHEKTRLDDETETWRLKDEAITALRQEMKRSIDEMGPLLASASEGLSQLSKVRFAEVRNLKQPSTVVRVVLQCLYMVMFNECLEKREEYWNEQREMLESEKEFHGPTEYKKRLEELEVEFQPENYYWSRAQSSQVLGDPKLTLRLLSLKKDSIDETVIAQVSHLLRSKVVRETFGDDDFGHGGEEKKRRKPVESRPCLEALWRWMLALLNYREVVAGMKPKQERLGELTSELGLLEMVRKEISRSLASKTSELSILEAQRENLKEKEKSLCSRLENARTKSEKAFALCQQLGDEVRGNWVDQLDLLRLQEEEDTSDGSFAANALLISACCMYLSAIGDSERQEVCLGEWMGLLLDKGLKPSLSNAQQFVNWTRQSNKPTKHSTFVNTSKASQGDENEEGEDEDEDGDEDGDEEEEEEEEEVTLSLPGILGNFPMEFGTSTQFCFPLGEILKEDYTAKVCQVWLEARLPLSRPLISQACMVAHILQSNVQAHEMLQRSQAAHVQRAFKWALQVPLLQDPFGLAEKWIVEYMGGREHVLIVDASDTEGRLETAFQEARASGRPLLVRHVTLDLPPFVARQVCSYVNDPMDGRPYLLCLSTREHSRHLLSRELGAFVNTFDFSLRDKEEQLFSVALLHHTFARAPRVMRSMESWTTFAVVHLSTFIQKVQVEDFLIQALSGSEPSPHSATRSLHKTEGVDLQDLIDNRDLTDQVLQKSDDFARILQRLQDWKYQQMEQFKSAILLVWPFIGFSARCMSRIVCFHKEVEAESALEYGKLCEAVEQATVSLWNTFDAVIKQQQQPNAEEATVGSPNYKRARVRKAGPRLNVQLLFSKTVSWEVLHSMMIQAAFAFGETIGIYFPMDLREVLQGLILLELEYTRKVKVAAGDLRMLHDHFVIGSFDGSSWNVRVDPSTGSRRTTLRKRETQRTVKRSTIMRRETRGISGVSKKRLSRSVRNKSKILLRRYTAKIDLTQMIQKPRQSKVPQGRATLADLHASKDFVEGLHLYGSHARVSTMEWSRFMDLLLYPTGDDALAPTLRHVAPYLFGEEKVPQFSVSATSRAADPFDEIREKVAKAGSGGAFDVFYAFLLASALRPTQLHVSLRQFVFEEKQDAQFHLQSPQLTPMKAELKSRYAGLEYDGIRPVELACLMSELPQDKLVVCFQFSQLSEMTATELIEKACIAQSGRKPRCLEEFGKDAECEENLEALVRSCEETRQHIFIQDLFGINSKTFAVLKGLLVCQRSRKKPSNAKDASSSCSDESGESEDESENESDDGESAQQWHPKILLLGGEGNVVCSTLAYQGVPWSCIARIWLRDRGDLYYDLEDRFRAYLATWEEQTTFSAYGGIAGEMVWRQLAIALCFFEAVCAQFDSSIGNSVRGNSFIDYRLHTIPRALDFIANVLFGSGCTNVQAMEATNRLLFALVRGKSSQDEYPGQTADECLDGEGIWAALGEETYSQSQGTLRFHDISKLQSLMERVPGFRVIHFDVPGEIERFVKLAIEIGFGGEFLTEMHPRACEYMLIEVLKGMELVVPSSVRTPPRVNLRCSMATLPHCVVLDKDQGPRRVPKTKPQNWFGIAGMSTVQDLEHSKSRTARVRALLQRCLTNKRQVETEVEDIIASMEEVEEQVAKWKLVKKGEGEDLFTIFVREEAKKMKRDVRLWADSLRDSQRLDSKEAMQRWCEAVQAATMRFTGASFEAGVDFMLSKRAFLEAVLENDQVEELWLPAFSDCRAALWFFLSRVALRESKTVMELELYCSFTPVAAHDPLFVISGLALAGGRWCTSRNRVDKAVSDMLTSESLPPLFVYLSQGTPLLPSQINPVARFQPFEETEEIFATPSTSIMPCKAIDRRLCNRFSSVAQFWIPVPCDLGKEGCGTLRIEIDCKMNQR